MTTAIALLTLAVGQLAYSTTITVDTISDPTGWLTARDWLHVGETFEIDAYVWYEIEPGFLSGNADIHQDERRWLVGSGLYSRTPEQDTADYIGGQLDIFADFATGAARVLIGWDQIHDPPLPYHDPATITGTITPRVPLLHGDATRDGRFDSSDLIAVFTAGDYETGERVATWDTGDWDLNGWFRSDDLIVALATGAYEQPAAARATPEPAAGWLLSFGLLALLGKIHPVRGIQRRHA